MNATTTTTGTTLNRPYEDVISLSISLAIIIVLSLCGNFLMILAFIRNKGLRSSFANKLIMSLAMSDLITAAFPLTYQLATVINVELIRGGGLLCTIGGLASYSFFFTSVFTLVMLSVDRFIALGYPLRYRLQMTSKVKAIMLLYPWVHGVLFFALCAAFTEVEFGEKSLDCGLSWHTRSLIFTLAILMVHVGIPLLLLIVCNTWTLILVRAQNKRMIGYGLQGTKENTIIKRDLNKRVNIEIKLARVSIVIIFVFLACWTPYVVTRSVVFFGLSLSSGIMSGAAWSVHASSFVNPMIYSYLRMDLRRAMLNACLCCSAKTSTPIVKATGAKIIKDDDSIGDSVTSINDPDILPLKPLDGSRQRDQSN